MGATQRTTAEPLWNKVTRNIKVEQQSLFWGIRFDLDTTRVKSIQTAAKTMF